MYNNQFLRMKNSLLDLENFFTELKGIELKDRKDKIKKEIEKLFNKSIIVSKNDIDKFEEQEMKKVRPMIKNCFDQLIKQNVMGKKPKIIRDKLKDKIVKISEYFLILKKNTAKRRSKMKKIIKDNLIGDMRILFEQEREEDYSGPKRVSNFWNNNYIKYESNGDKNRNLSLDVYLKKIESYLKNIIIDIRNSDTWKIYLTIATNFISSKDTKEEGVMHSSSDNIKFTTNSDENDVIENLFNSLRSKYQDG